MSEATSRLRELARELLSSGQVQLVIGWEAGTEGSRSRPVFISAPEQADKLIVGPTCTANLANYVRKLPGKTAVVLKGCDARAIAVLISENQLPREAVHLIGVPCEGLVDLEKLKASGVRIEDVTGLAIEGGNVIVSLGPKQTTVPVADALRDECLGCQCPTPPLADVLLGEEIGPREDALYRALQSRIMALSAEEREAYFADHFARCIRCYACVRACPMCYCTTCFAVQTRPQYVPRTVGPDENRMFHLGRALHLAGRCVACGACDRACPVNIPLRALNTKLDCETRDLFGTVAGLKMDEKPPLIDFLPGDTETALDTGH
jgi:formate dehydrogenase (coenzyme F420) beta subunit